MSEPVFCSTCMKVQPARVERGCGMTMWICDHCNSVCDHDFDDIGIDAKEVYGREEALK